MEKKNRMIMMFLIILGLISMRTIISQFDKVDVPIMAWINGIALYLIIIQIINETYKSMEKRHSELGKGKTTHIKVNSKMKKFKNISFISLIIIFILELIYMIKFGNTVGNDILTIVALILSMESNNITEVLFESFYNYY